MTLQDVESLKTKALSKRILLGVVNGFGDFLGIAKPFTIRFQVLMRKLFMLEEPLTWDQAVPEQCRKEWVDLVVETLESGGVPFPRSTLPCTALTDRGPEVIGFSDHGQEAY